MTPTAPAAVFLALLLAGSTAIACKRRSEVPPDIAIRYQQDASRLCNAIVDCLKEEVSESLRQQPERRALVLSRMTRDLCREQQYARIGQASAAAGPQSPEFDASVYRAYSGCSQAIAAAEPCAERRRLYREHADCALLRLYRSSEP